MVQDLSYNLCESLVENIDGVAGDGKHTPPTPITYLTQWKIVGNSEVKTLPYPDGVVLPNGYTRCKYLEFHGTEYFDSGIIPEQGIELHAKYMLSKNSHITGTRTNAFSPGSFYILIGGSPASYQVSYGGKVLDSNSEDKPSIEFNTLMEVALTSQTFRLNNYTKNVETTIIKGSKSIYIGATNGISTSFGGVKIYEYSLSLNDAVIFNGIPCLDDSNDPCLYDTVSGTTLYNQGTGTLGYEVEAQPTEIWSCGEYNAIDGKYHIIVQPLGGSVADIALTEPLRKVNNVADTIEFPSNTEGKALVTRPFASENMGDMTWDMVEIVSSGYFRFRTRSISSTAKGAANNQSAPNALIAMYDAISPDEVYYKNTGFTIGSKGILLGYDPDYNQSDSAAAFKTAMNGVELIYELATPTTELVDAPQIAEAESYSMVISQGAKAVEWSDFETD